MKKKVALVGGFHKARSLAYSLIQNGYDVTVINANYQHCQILSEIPKLHVIYGDGTKPYVLEDAEIHNLDIIIALSQQDEVNLIVCELCKKFFHIKRAIAIVNDARKSKFFYEMGIDSVVCATDMIASVIEQQAFIENIAATIPFSNNNINISGIIIPDTSPIAGKYLNEIKLPQNAVIVCILRNSFPIIPKGNIQICKQDFIILLANSQTKSEAIRILIGQ